MANKAISELPQALNVNNQDLFVLEQSGIAKKLTAETFITEQGIIDALAEALDGHGGIQSVTLSSVSGRIRTYLITFTDGTSTTFQVLDGTSIDRIVKTSTAGLTDTYTVFMSDGTTTFFTVTNGADGTVSEAMLNDALKDKAPAITETTESSAIANFTDGADDLVMHNVIAEINPVQDLSNGDPSPSNICPITGWTGCNVTRTGTNLFNASDGIQDKLLGRGTGSLSNNTSYMVSDFIPVQPTIKYYYGQFNIWYHTLYDINKNVLSGVLGTTNATSITIPSGEARYIRLSCQKTAQDTAFFSETATAYEPYQGTTLTVDWSTEAGAVYGGTIDVATGLLTVDGAIVDLGDLTWTYNSGQLCMVSQDIKNLVGNGANVICDRYATTTDLRSNPLSSRDKVVGINKANSSTSGNFATGALIVKDTSYTNASTFKTAVTGSKLVYELATPQTYQLTGQQLKTLLGTNNVWADTGNISVTYPADTKMFIEKLTMPTEDDLVANQAITSGKYFMIGNSLYLALANIASGAQITIGTNAQRVSLADALNTINT